MNDERRVLRGKIEAGKTAHRAVNDLDAVLYLPNTVKNFRDALDNLGRYQQAEQILSDLADLRTRLAQIQSEIFQATNALMTELQG